MNKKHFSSFSMAFIEANKTVFLESASPTLKTFNNYTIIMTN